MLGESAQWSPWRHLAEKHPDVRVYRRSLPGGLMGCVDLEQRVIWLAADLDPVMARCTLAYELAQLEQGPLPEDACMAAAHRKAAEDWAARMLISTGRLLSGFRISYSLDEIASALEVDSSTLRARLRGLTDQEQDDVMELLRHLSAVA